MKRKVLEYSITSSAALLMAFLIAIMSGLFQYKEQFRIMAAWCDGFFISGVFVTCIGLLLFIHNCGFFDIIAYGIMRFISLFKRKPTQNKYDTYYDYHVMRAEKPKSEFGYFLVVGIGFILISLIFLLFWAQASGEI